MPKKQTVPTRSYCAACQQRAQGCELVKPNCTQCSRSKNLKLFWPRVNDHRRTIVSKSALSLPTSSSISDARFVHTSLWDIEVYHSFVSSTALPIALRSKSWLEVPDACNPANLNASEVDLLEYFCSSAASALAIFGHDATTLGRILVRIALDEVTPSAKAVFKGLLAFSSLHRYGSQRQAVELKIEAIGNLAAGAATPAFCAKQTLQHIAAGMLLCSYEVHQSSCTSGHWTGYLAGVKKVINACSVKTLLRFDPNAAVLLDWAYYHDILACYSLQHWSRGGAPELPSTPIESYCSQVSGLPQPIFSMLDLLSQICSTVSSTVTSATSDTVNDHKSFLEILDWRIRSLLIPEVAQNQDDATRILQLYQLALLIYLRRGTEDLVPHDSRMQQYIDKSFGLVPQVGSCTQQFPIFVIGCEARTDEQRATILDIISRTVKLSSSRSFNYTEKILQAVWAQTDLAYGNNVSYRDILTSVTNRAIVTPSYV